MSNLGKAPKEKTDVETSLYTKFNDFLRRNRLFIASVLGIAVLAIVGIGIVSTITESRLMKATTILETIETDFSTWNSAADEAEKASLSDSVLTTIDGFIAEYGNLYPALRARNLAASVFLGQENFLKAKEAYDYIYSQVPESHLAPIAMINAATMSENLGNLAEAKQLLTDFLINFPNDPSVNRVMFNIGRLAEDLGNIPDASSAYTQLITKGDQDDWTKLAHSRIIYFETQGISN
ncbi:MAG: hypothetical protein A2087_00570 [Spirochaetes bacterium GWD1_61_31]|nr:MAG: hypothetical protein A2Y37_02990 [Spirochaetes bacterium GWB1_60_80]OHD29583.1 MAG: hypothetical protein A2004_01525 [Spirochaetes bacterium GWC1_61_12]OHD37488.1 MAG: hypothetical protein A2087_00570 [Spirochaetes bacterium GWD1_61_31]OHD42003.1 MAG: hypothetical protein A2Y35_14700 [Spirochaetes bacterium GWE1_60_18]OHD61730.1 MAG: hypothetical protein A2Y32_13245 [Spirochaetes bacterium GWF1_60_12]